MKGVSNKIHWQMKYTSLATKDFLKVLTFGFHLIIFVLKKIVHSERNSNLSSYVL
jgi:hypothetical protein